MSVSLGRNTYGVSKALREHRARLAANRIAEGARLLLNGLHNSDDDPRLLFSGVTYQDARRVALHDPDVDEALRRLPRGYWRS